MKPLSQLQLTDKADEARRQFGWADDEFSGFVLGNEEVRKDEIKFNPPSIVFRIKFLSGFIN